MSAYAFLGAGEFEDWHADVDRVLLDGRARQDAGARDGRRRPRATTSTKAGSTKGWSTTRRSASTSRAPPLRTAADAQDPALRRRWIDSGLVFFSGGNPAYLASVLMGSPFWAAASGTRSPTG